MHPRTPRQAASEPRQEKPVQGHPAGIGQVALSRAAEDAQPARTGQRGGRRASDPVSDLRQCPRCQAELVEPVHRLRDNQPLGLEQDRDLVRQLGLARAGKADELHNQSGSASRTHRGCYDRKGRLRRRIRIRPPLERACAWGCCG